MKIFFLEINNIKSRRCTHGCTSRRALGTTYEHDITYSLTKAMFHHQNHVLRL